MKPGERLGSQNELARIHGVSVVTAREAVAVLVAEGLLHRRRGAGTFRSETAVGPEDLSGQGQSQQQGQRQGQGQGQSQRQGQGQGQGQRPAMIGVLLDLDIAHPSLSPFFTQTVQYLRLWLLNHGCRERFYGGFTPPNSDQRDLSRIRDQLAADLADGQLSGLIVLGKGFTEELQQLLPEPFPVVGSESSYPRSVPIDLAGMMQLGVEHLVAQGRRRIAFMGWGHRGKLADALRSHGLEPDPRWIRCDLPPASAGAGWEEFREIWFAREDKPDGLLISDDVLFHDAKSAIVACGASVPDDLLIVTHSNRRSFDPRPLSVSQLQIDPLEYAREIGGMMLQAIEEPGGSATRVWSCRLIPLEASEAAYYGDVRAELTEPISKSRNSS